jgi:hypothetical protein
MKNTLTPKKKWEMGCPALHWGFRRFFEAARTACLNFFLKG